MSNVDEINFGFAKVRYAILFNSKVELLCPKFWQVRAILFKTGNAL